MSGIDLKSLPFVLEFRLSGDEDADKRVLRLVRLLPGFHSKGEEKGVVQLPMRLAEADVFRDVLLDLVALVKDQPGSTLHLGEALLSGEDLEHALIILDCTTAHDMAPDAVAYCRSQQGYDWGCLYLRHVRPFLSEDGKLDREALKKRLREAASERHLALCPYFNAPRVDDAVAHEPEKDAGPPASWLKNKELSLSHAVRMAASSANPAPDTEHAIPVTTYADVGGLDKVIRILRETVELPLKHPEVLRHLGISPPRGVLLYGPPGCGKTLLARAVAHESGARFFSVSGPELITKWHGESEENLRNLFDEAQKSQPAVVFFDEIDAIAQARSSDESLRLDSRFTTQLLTILDGIHDLGRVAVLATTNRMDLLDQALLRPGRFDRLIEIPPPDRDGCRKILHIHVQKLPLAKDVDLEAIIEDLVGASGADIAYVVREAAYASLRRAFDLNALLEESVPMSEDRLRLIVVMAEDLNEGLKKMRDRNITIKETEAARTGRKIVERGS
ncbi:Adenosinetriphosphatase [Solidesulfovibrio fructosivorans JJ]]|uniref:Adenosinetriphosphatase n=1 Tax=Solidesulfovibrio fructosivorans JJ] TaxID=596151 RepID=E1JT56_SOLFR|nr:AAA family ATPase [Solidesulfovibrio fructosivorans]EFL52316.1 Adenosinetriphosphatase [Solidesulfovibrio fructosivorans JJ]]